MREAKSMYFGGEIIPAEDCDYQSSRELGLICPFCNSAVFIRSEAVRQARKGLQLVRPYFAHYPTGAEQNWDCEKRSHTKQGRAEIERVRIEARNQRLRLYNKYLWEMISTDRNILPRLLKSIERDFGKEWCEYTSVACRRGWRNNFESMIDYMNGIIDDVLSGALESPPPPHLNAKVWEEETLLQRGYIARCDRNLHRAIAGEVAEFLTTDSAGFVFHKMFKASVWTFIKVFEGSEAQAKRSEPRVFMAGIAGLIGGTRWVDVVPKFQNSGRSRGFG